MLLLPPAVVLARNLPADRQPRAADISSDLPLGSSINVLVGVTAQLRAYGDMEPNRSLTFTPVEHDDPRVRSVGFDLTDPYVEQCWSGVVGPSSTLLLRRLPALWTEQVPATIGRAELAGSLGLGDGSGSRSRLGSTLDRLVRFGLARPASDAGGLDVYRQVPPLRPGQLQRLPQWTQAAHERLFSDHLAQLSSQPSLAGPMNPVAVLTARLDRLQRADPAAGMAIPSHRALGR